MNRKLYNYSLEAMEKLDRRDTFIKRLGYRYARKIFDISFMAIYGYSPYDYTRNGDGEDGRDVWESI